MTYLLNLITYDGKHISEIDTEEGRQQIINLATKIASLEDEIKAHESGVIDIRSSGILFTTLLPPELGQKIRDLI